MPASETISGTIGLANGRDAAGPDCMVGTNQRRARSKQSRDLARDIMRELARALH